MVDYGSIVIRTLLLSPSGALSPGPLTVMTIYLGAKKGWKAGLAISLGHILVELPYIIVLTLLFANIRNLMEGLIGDAITLIGVGIMLFFAYAIVKSGVKMRSLSDYEGRGGRLAKLSENPLIVGALFTGLNAPFLLWWLSVGLQLIYDLASAGTLTVLLVYPAHVWMDIVWLAIIAELSSRALQMFSGKGYRILLLFSGLMLLLFGVNTALRRFAGLSILP